MIACVIATSARNPLPVLLATLFLVAAGVWAVLNTPLDAIPDLSDTQVIVYTDYPGQAPQVVEDQVTYPLTTALLAVPRSKVVRGFSASVWVYPTTAGDRLHFLADSNAGITKGIVALILLAVQDRAPDAVAALDIQNELAPFALGTQLSANRTQGIPNMIALIRETAARYAHAA